MAQPDERPSRLRRVVSFMGADGEMQVDQREDKHELRKRLVSYSALTRQFMLVLTLSTAIGSLGLLADSEVTILGAMLIAPLMKPILAYAYGIVTADSRLQFRALITLVVGILITILVAGLVVTAVGLSGATAQIMARTRPTLIDLGVAVAAGVAASLATVRHNIADTLPGVAIAVALVPPLCVAGIGFAVGAWSIGGGATLLFAVNLVAIVLAAANVLVIDGYSHLRQASHGLLALILLAACVLTIPLTRSMEQLQADDRAQATIEKYLHEQYSINHVVHPNDLSRLDARWFEDHVFVFVEIKSPPSELGEDKCRELQRRLEEALEKPVNLKVQLLLSNEIRVYPHRLPSGDLPDYGADDLIPRR